MRENITSEGHCKCCKNTLQMMWKGYNRMPQVICKEVATCRRECWTDKQKILHHLKQITDQNKSGKYRTTKKVVQVWLLKSTFCLIYYSLPLSWPSCTRLSECSYDQGLHFFHKWIKIYLNFSVESQNNKL